MTFTKQLFHRVALSLLPLEQPADNMSCCNSGISCLRLPLKFVQAPEFCISMMNTLFVVISGFWTLMITFVVSEIILVVLTVHGEGSHSIAWKLGYALAVTVPGWLLLYIEVCIRTRLHSRLPSQMPAIVRASEMHDGNADPSSCRPRCTAIPSQRLLLPVHSQPSRLCFVVPPRAL